MTDIERATHHSDIINAPSYWLESRHPLMTSPSPDEAPAAPAVLPRAAVAGAGTGDVDTPVDERHRLTAEQIRVVVRLFQCPRCSFPLQEPTTLPCGKTICRKCLPETHVRVNISYPATANRLQGFQCPFPDCGREHAAGDCSLDVTLNKVLPVWKAKYEEARAEAEVAKLVTNISIKDPWEAAAVPSLKDDDRKSQALPGGRLMATYLLAELGELQYTSEVTYWTPDSSDLDNSDTAVLARVKEVTRVEMDCHVCYALFYDAVTTPCGHTFCRTCLQRVLDHACHCPVCRRQLTVQPLINRAGSPPNELLKDITTAFWSDLLESRRQAILREGLVNEEQDFDISVFVCTLAFPSMPTFLHVFEPRYRLMIRRALEGDRNFGMVLYLSRGFGELGTVLRIVNAEFFADGRSLIETIGVSRFRILRHDVIDGYTVAKIERITDISIAEEEELEAREISQASSISRDSSADGSNAALNEAGHAGTASPTTSRFPTTRQEVETLATRTLMEFAIDFVRRMREQSVGWLTARILAIYGECPDDPALFPWWFANILPVRELEKYRLLGTTSVRERLKICCGWILEWEASRCKRRPIPEADSSILIQSRKIDKPTTGLSWTA